MMPAEPPIDDAFVSRRSVLREEFLARHFLLGGWPGGTDTYKRVRWQPIPSFRGRERTICR